MLSSEQYDTISIENSIGLLWLCSFQQSSSYLNANYSGAVFCSKPPWFARKIENVSRYCVWQNVVACVHFCEKHCLLSKYKYSRFFCLLRVLQQLLHSLQFGRYHKIKCPDHRSEKKLWSFFHASRSCDIVVQSRTFTWNFSIGGSAFLQWGFRFVRYSENRQKLHWFIVFHVSV